MNKKYKDTDLYQHLDDKKIKEFNRFIKKIKNGKLSEEEIEKALFWRKPISIKEFLTHKYIGSLDRMLYKKWREVIERDIFCQGSIVNEVILGGSTGSGKSTVAILIQFYNLVRVLCYRNPQLILGVPETSTLGIVLINITKTKTELTLLKAFKSFLSICTLFEQQKWGYDLSSVELKPDKPIPYTVEKSQLGDFLHFPNNVLVYGGSILEHALSMNLIGAILDEAEFRKRGSAEALESYTTIKERIENRFLDRRNWILTLVSSAKHQTSEIAEYIDSVSNDSNTSKKYSFAIFDVKYFDSYAKGYFYVFGGNKRIPSKIISKKIAEKYLANRKRIPQSCDILKVPLTYKEHFKTNIVRALRNIAGFATSENEPFVDIFSSFKNYDKSLHEELDVEARLKSPKPLQVHIKDLFTEIPNLNMYLKRAPKALRYIHLDLAETTEAGICMIHKELAEDGLTQYYVVDFIMKVTSIDRIDIEKIQDLITDLARTYNVRFHSITADQYQSAQLLQFCLKHSLAVIVDRQSVVRTFDPYLNFATICNKDLLKIGYAPTLHEQVKAGEVGPNDEFITTKRKDLIDAIAGACFLAMENRNDIPIYKYNELSKVKKRKKDTTVDKEESKYMEI